MSKSLKLVVLIVCSLFLAIFFSPTLTFAVDTESGNIIETTFWGNLKDDGSGCGVYTILNMVVDILSFGIGILAAIGITIVGVKYLTAGGNEEQTRMARHRMSQIVIGIVVYVLLYVGVQWLLPGGKLNSGQKCTVVSNDELAQIKAKEKAEKEEQNKRNERATGASQSGKSGSSSNSSSVSIAECKSKSSIKPKKSKGDGYSQIVKLCGREFKLYKQVTAQNNKPYDLPGSKFYPSTISLSGCGAVSLSIILSGYGQYGGPVQITKGLHKSLKALNLKDPRNSKAVRHFLKSKGFKYKYHSNGGESTATTIKNMRKALLSGRKLHVYVGQHKSKASHGNHFVPILAIDPSNDMVFVGNPSYNSKGYVWMKLSELADARHRSHYWLEVYK